MLQIELTWNHLQGEVMMKTANGEVGVRLLPCFPWLYPHSHFSLRDKDNNELAFIKSLNELSEESRKAVERSLKEALFCFEVIDILKVDEEFELRVWKVQTTQGVRSFQTKLTDWPRSLHTGGYVIQDVQGDLFVLRDPKILSKTGRKQFMAFID